MSGYEELMLMKGTKLEAIDEILELNLKHFRIDNCKRAKNINRIRTMEIGKLEIAGNGEHSRYPIDNTYSIQTSRVGVLAESPTSSLIEKKTFLFEKVTDDIVPKIGLPKSLQVTKIGTDSFHLDVLTSEIYNERLDTKITLRR